MAAVTVVGLGTTQPRALPIEASLERVILRNAAWRIDDGTGQCLPTYEYVFAGAGKGEELSLDHSCLPDPCNDANMPALSRLLGIELRDADWEFYKARFGHMCSADLGEVVTRGRPFEFGLTPYLTGSDGGTSTGTIPLPLPPVAGPTSDTDDSDAKETPNRRPTPGTNGTPITPGGGNDGGGSFVWPDPFPPYWPPVTPKTPETPDDGDDAAGGFAPPSVPLPATGWLVIGAFASLAAARRRRN